MTSFPIEIIHIVNPSRFYFRNILTEKEEVDQIKEIEEKMKTYVENLPKTVRNSLMNFYIPRVGEIVAFYTKKEKKWIRCMVDESKKFNEVPSIIMWAIDYGEPLYTTHSECVLPLPNSFRNPESKILTGCLPLMPATMRYDYAAGGLVMDIKENWGSLAIAKFKTLAMKSQQVFFNQSENLEHKDFLVGDVVFEANSFSSHLVAKELASCVPDNLFLIYYSKLFTNHIERWNDNERSGGILKYPDANENDSRFEIEENDVPEMKSIATSFTEECVRKVHDWQVRNEGFFNASLCSDSDISFASHSNQQKLVNSPIVYEPEVDEFSGVSAKELRRLLEIENQDQDEQEKEVRSSYRSRMLFMPAGSSMNLTAASFLDENFLSVSQVALNESAASGAGGGDNGFAVQQRDSIDSMAIRFESQKI